MLLPPAAACRFEQLLPVFARVEIAADLLAYESSRVESIISSAIEQLWLGNLKWAPFSVLLALINLLSWAATCARLPAWLPALPAAACYCTPLAPVSKRV